MIIFLHSVLKTVVIHTEFGAVIPPVYALVNISGVLHH